MIDKIYLNAKELKERWGISDGAFHAMQKAGNLPVDTILNKATLYHIDDVRAYEETKRNAAQQVKEENENG